jgi:hypothetical protein
MGASGVFRCCKRVSESLWGMLEVRGIVDTRKRFGLYIIKGTVRRIDGQARCRRRFCPDIG